MKTYRTVLLAILICASTPAIAQNLSNCTLAGEAMNDAMKAEAFRVAFNEDLPSLRIAFHSLPKAMQKTVLTDIEAIKPWVQKSTMELLVKSDEWNRQKMDGPQLVRQILTKTYASQNEAYTIKCLKSSNE